VHQGECAEHEIDVNVLVSTMIAVLGRITASTAGTNIEHQDKLISFIGKSLRLSIAENGYRPVTSEMDDAIPPWEKN